MSSLARGRGRLSSIDMLPAEADPIVAWAAKELRDRDRTAKEIHAEFNAKLAALGLGPISASSFHRHSVRQAQLARRLEETRAITSTLAERFGPGESDDLTLFLTETIKTLIVELLEEGGDAGWSPKQAKEMAEALRAVVAAQKVSTERRAKLERELADRTTAAVEVVAKEAGLSKDLADQIRDKVLGLAS